MNDVSYGALALALAILGGLYTWQAWRRRGPGAAVRGAGLTMLPIGLWLMGALSLAGRIVAAIGHWMVSLVFSPIVWIGVIITAVAIVLMGVGGLVARRTTGRTAGRTTAASLPKPVGKGSRPQPAIVDDDMAEIEALLKKRRIS